MDGVNYPVYTFDVIYIAINVWPIDGLLLHLAQTMKPTARILCKGSHNDIAVRLKKKRISIAVFSKFYIRASEDPIVFVNEKKSERLNNR